MRDISHSNQKRRVVTTILSLRVDELNHIHCRNGNLALGVIM